MKPIPSLQEIQQALANDFRSLLQLITSPLKRFLNAHTGVIAAQLKLNYLFLADIQENHFPDTADIEANGGTLERFGRIRLNRNPKPATVGIFEVLVTGTNGSVLRSGITFKSNDGTTSPGQLYVLDAEYTLSGSGDTIQIRALGGGSDFDLNVGDNLTITEPVIGVNQTVTVDVVIVQPRSSEDIDVYRQLIIDTYQLEPTGGSRSDYRLWSADALGVRKVYPYVKNGDAGTIQLYVEATVVDSTDGYGTPDQPMLDDVESVVEFDPDATKPLYARGRRPMGKVMEVLPIELVPVDVTITGLNISTSNVTDAISDNMVEYLYDIRPYIPGADLLRNKKDVLYSSGLQSVVTNVLDTGNYFLDFQMQVDGVVSSSFTFALGKIPYLRNVTYN